MKKKNHSRKSGKKEVIKIAKEKPWKSVNRFKRRKSTKKVGHPVWVYKKRGRFFKFLTFTHTPEKDKENDYEKLKHNIDPKDKSACYVKKSFEINHSNAFEEPEKEYRIHPKDRDTVRKYQK